MYVSWFSGLISHLSDICWQWLDKMWIDDCGHRWDNLPATVYGRSLLHGPGKMRRIFGPLQKSNSQSFSSYQSQPAVSLFEDVTIEPFQTFTSPDSLALSVPWTCLEKRICQNVQKRMFSYVDFIPADCQTSHRRDQRRGGSKRGGPANSCSATA